MLTGIIPQSKIQGNLFSKKQQSNNQHELMRKIDDINTKYGSDTAHFAATGFEQSWQMKQQFLSPKYTTSWDNLMEISC
ncbi:protein UmuC [Fodinibius salicampi]